MRGNTPEDANGPEIDVPSVTRFRAFANACAMTALPHVSSLGKPNKACRIAICHKNETNMLGTFTSILGNAKINIDAIANKSRGDFAYTLIDTDTVVPAEVVKALEASAAVIRVRIVK